MPSPTTIDLGNYDLMPNLTAGSLNADLVPSTDVSHYGWISLCINADVYAGTLSFQGSLDNTVWSFVYMPLMSSLDGALSFYQTGSSSIITGCPVSFPFFRVRMTTYSSGTATGSLQLFRKALPGFQLVSHNFRLADVGTTNNRIGLFANNGYQNTAVAASTSADTVINAKNGFLSHVLVTAAGSAAMNIYDNASAGSGMIVGVIPSTATVTGVPFKFKAPCANGITIKGDAASHGVTVFYSDVHA